MPNLIQVQRNSYDNFLQMNVKPEERKNVGLQAVLSELFPIDDFNKKSQIDFVEYELEHPKYEESECRQRGMNYATALRVVLRLIVWVIDENSGARSVRDMKDEKVFMGEIPLMTERGTFIINGTERTVVSQMHRSPGVVFDHDKGKGSASGKQLYSARIIPYRGSWLEFEFDSKDILYMRIDRRRKLPVTTLLMALDNDESVAYRARCEAKGEKLQPQFLRGRSKEEILHYFYDEITYTKSSKGWSLPVQDAIRKGRKYEKSLTDAQTGEVVIEAGSVATPLFLKQLEKDGTVAIGVDEATLLQKYLSRDLINKQGLVLGEAGDPITENLLRNLLDNGYSKLAVLDIDNIRHGSHLRDTLAADKNETREEVLIDIYRAMRPGEPPTFETAEQLFGDLFFNNDRYDLSAVGRVKMNSRLGISSEEVSDEVRVLRAEDIFEVVRILVRLKDGEGRTDDIDNLGNRRVRSVGELMENQYRMGLLRMQRSISERMGSVDINTALPHDLINAKPSVAAVREFFGSSQLSQFMDQTNPLSEITHKRRVSALGPGGLKRDRAMAEVRDVHPTHYGRICPIETPEGANIGLINSLATFAKINKYGFIETPYKRVVDGVVQDEIVYMSAMDEEGQTIAEASAATDSKGRLTREAVPCRRGADYVVVPPSDINLIDISPKQSVSVAASLIPFLENDDANRALMGSNMQRQAVPLLKAEAPFVGTGMEGRVAYDSGAAIIAKRSGIVDQVDAIRIVIRVTETVDPGDSAVDVYNLMKFQRSNQSTCINQRPLVKIGDTISVGDIIADGSCTDLGELALGRNVLVAFMPWNGYNFEDSILISERIVSDDVFTSIHIEEFDVMARDTKLGQEEITRDIPNLSEDNLRNLDEAGIVYIGAEVRAGDILVGKITPKEESQVTPEEKLLRAIFGEKSSHMRDTSLRVPSGFQGTVVDVRIFSRRGVEKDERALAIEREEIEALAQDRNAERSILERSFRARFLQLAKGHKLKVALPGLAKGSEVTSELFEEHPSQFWRKAKFEDNKLNGLLLQIGKQFDDALGALNARFEDRVEKVRAGDEMLQGVMKMVKVFVAVKRKLQPGDKMAGRHGNKGVVSKIMPLEDMPYLEDGQPVDIVLNPLGVPSRMNIGQILETHLGWACHGLGQKIRSAYNYYREKGGEENLRETLCDCYDDSQISDDIKGMSTADLVELSGNLTHGLSVATPVFDGASENDINDMLFSAGLHKSGQVRLIDGRTGDYFERDVTVGYIYMLKLHHLVDDKIHARSVGSYSLVTQQPLGGKAQFGGQRFGEMEVWALEAYGAAYTLQEMLTIKSDDVEGRTKIYDAIARDDDSFEAGIPESFNVLIRELRSLGLNVELLQN